MSPRRLLEVLCVAGGMALGLGFSPAALAEQSTPALADDVLAKLVSTARQRQLELLKEKKAVEKRIADQQKRSSKVERTLRKAKAQDWTQIYNLYKGEGTALWHLHSTLERENKLLISIVEAESRGLSSLAMFPFAVADTAQYRLRMAKDLDLAKFESQERWRAIREDDMTPALREQLQLERSAVGLAEVALSQEWQLLSNILAATGSLSPEEGLKRAAQVHREEIQRYEQREKRLEESKEAWGALIAAGSAALVLSQILNSTELSPEQKQVQIQHINTILQNDCTSRGGYFVGAGEFSLGHCSIP